MAGFFARQFFNETGTRIGRITALDAAGPIFEALEIFPRKGDAKFVEALHKSGGNNIVESKYHRSVYWHSVSPTCTNVNGRKDP